MLWFCKRKSEVMHFFILS